MSRRIFLHVGTPKSGTTYLQAVLWHNATALRANGLLLPGRVQAHYAAAKGVTSRRGVRRDVSVDMDTAWSRLLRQVNRWPSDALISHELLAPATAAQARQSLAGLHGEVHVVLTTRGLHKQVPASWQEQVKSGLSTPYDVFLSRVHDEKAKGAWFWRVQDVADIADRWGAHLPPEQIHVVTVPAHSTDPAVLWNRYAAVLALDGTAYDLAVPPKNVSLGVVESELLRRVHSLQDHRFTDDNRHPWTRRLLATEILGRRSSAPIMTPTEAHAWLERRGAEILETVRARGYAVAGSLDDLRWQPPPAGARLLSSVTESEITDATKWTLHQLRRVLSQRKAAVTPPDVGPVDGLTGILELLEHIRALDTDAPVRAAAAPVVTQPSAAAPPTGRPVTASPVPLVGLLRGRRQERAV